MEYLVYSVRRIDILNYYSYLRQSVYFTTPLFLSADKQYKNPVYRKGIREPNANIYKGYGNSPFPCKSSAFNSGKPLLSADLLFFLTQTLRNTIEFLPFVKLYYLGLLLSTELLNKIIIIIVFYEQFLKALP